MQVKRALPDFIFDIGGVVIVWRNNDPLFRAVAKKYRVPFRKIRSVMRPLLAELESGNISPKKYIQNSLCAVGKRIRPDENPTALLALPFAKLAKDRRGVIHLINKLKRSGHRVFAFSNTSSPHTPIMKRRGWTTPLFDSFYSSWRIGARKPSVAAYRKVLGLIGADPHDVVFVDNKKENVAGARRAGIRFAVQFTSVKSLLRRVREILRRYYSQEYL